MRLAFQWRTRPPQVLACGGLVLFQLPQPGRGVSSSKLSTRHV